MKRTERRITRQHGPVSAAATPLASPASSPTPARAGTRAQFQPWLAYLVAVLSTALAALIHWGLGQAIGTPWTPYIIFYAAILASALLGGTGPGLLATTLSALTITLLYLPPRGNFSIHRPADQLGLTLFCACNIVISLVCAALRTARARTLQEARRAQDSEERFRLFMEHTPTLVWVKDDQGRYVFLNQAYEQRFGITLAHCQGKTDTELWDRDTAARLRQNDETALAAGHPIELIEETTERDGRVSFWHNTKFSFRDRSGRRFLASLGLDITPRKRAEDALRYSEQKLAAAFAHNPAAIAITRLEDGTCLEANERLFSLLGYTREEILGHSLRALPIWLSPEAVARFLDELRVRGSLRGWEQQLCKKSGELLTAQLSAQVLELDGEKVILTTAVDITERLAAEQALKRSEERLRIALQTAQLGTWDYDFQNDETTGDDQARAMFGLTAQRLTFGQFLDCIHPEDRDPVATAVLQATCPEGSGAYHMEYRVRWSDGSLHWIAADGQIQFEGEGPQRQATRFIGTSMDITARKQAEEAWRTREAELGEAQRLAHIGSWYWSLHDDRPTMSAEGLRIFGLDPAIDTMPRFKDQPGRCYPVQDWERLREAVQRAMQTGTPYELDMQAFRHGELIWITARGEAMRDTEGHIVGLRGTIQDITERKRAEARLRTALHKVELERLRLHESEQRALLAVETAALGTYERNLLTNELRMNAVCRELLGIGPAPPPPDVAPRSLHPEDKDRVLALVARAFDPALREICAAEFRILRPDGSLRWVAGRGRVMFDDSVQPPCATKFLGVLYDITDRKRAEEALCQSELRERQRADELAAVITARDQALAQLNALLENAPLGFAFFDREHRYARINEFLALRINGLPVEAHLGRTIGEVLPLNAHALNSLLDSVFTSGNAIDNVIVTGETPATLGEQHHWLSAFFPVRTPDGHIPWVGALVLDITQQKRTELALQNTRKALARANAYLDRTVQERTTRLHETIADLEGFSYSLVHDMRAPLRAMEGYAALLERRLGLTLRPAERELLHKIQLAASRMDRLITDSLNYTRILREQLPLAPVDLGPLLRGILETYPNLQPPHADITIDIEHLLVHGNEAALTQVFSNLLGNAVKFVAPGVHPRVRIRAQRRHGEHAHVAAPGPGAPETGHAPRPTPHAPHVLIWVEDNGIGIPNDAHETIFGMFQRLHQAEEYPGTGIGLALVKKSLDRTGGQITVESEPGKGSRFCVQLPLVPETDPAAKALTE